MSAVEGGLHRRARRDHTRAGDEQRCDEERHHVEPHVAARDAARRVSVRDAEARQLGRPAPDADRRAVQLERSDDEEDAGVRRTRTASARGRCRATARRRRRRRRDAADTVSPASPQRASRSPPRRPRPARATSAGEREPAEVHDPVRGRDEQRQVVQPVRVDAPDERAGHLADGREHDDAERLRARERLGAARSAASSTSHVSAPSE